MPLSEFFFENSLSLSSYLSFSRQSLKGKQDKQVFEEKSNKQLDIALGKNRLKANSKKMKF
jgi:hypothetical protein